MIKFFRKIRQTAITETKYGKYILYAIGEIILVVIGILIALQLNNRKERSDINIKQHNYLALIKGEMESNLNTLSDESEDLLAIIQDSRALITLIDSDSAIASINENELSELLLMPTSRSISIDYENGAFNEFISTGGLKDIQNDSIRGMLRSWESKLNTLRAQELALQQFLRKTVNYVEIHGSYRVIFDDIELSEDLSISNSKRILTNKQLLKSKQFENILLPYLAIAIQLHEKNYPSFENDIKSLTRLITEELKK